MDIYIWSNSLFMWTIGWSIYGYYPILAYDVHKYIRVHGIYNFADNQNTGEESTTMNIIWQLMERADTLMFRAIIVGIVGVIIIQLWVV